MKSARHLVTAAEPEAFPRHHFPEIAIVGRSNVGKSSLINDLLRIKGLARVSSTPGKTQTINFYLVDERLCIVDLPGYGYAKAAKSLREKWGDLIQSYLENRKQLKLILVLLDIRHLPSAEDMEFVTWAEHSGRRCVFLFTKTDKVDENTYSKNRHTALKRLGMSHATSLFYSIKDTSSRKRLIDQIKAEEALWD